MCISFTAERKTSLGKDWHSGCLKCEKCKRTLAPGSHAEVGNALVYAKEGGCTVHMQINHKTWWFSLCKLFRMYWDIFRKQDRGKDIRYSELLLQRQHILHRYCHLNVSSFVKTPEWAELYVRKTLIYSYFLIGNIYFAYLLESTRHLKIYFLKY